MFSGLIFNIFKKLKIQTKDDLEKAKENIDTVVITEEEKVDLKKFTPYRQVKNELADWYQLINRNDDDDTVIEKLRQYVKDNVYDFYGYSCLNDGKTTAVVTLAK